MTKRIAVVTDAVSDGFFFPVWYDYYASLFGGENIYVVTYEGADASFASFKLGGLIRLPVMYSDPIRRDVISDLVTALLRTYDRIVRVDTDEILVTDTLSAPPLREYIETLDRPYSTAYGFDVVQLPHEAELGANRNNILSRRTVAYPNSALNKTCITSTPINWVSGFHWCNVYPSFGPLFMLHLKRVDINWQMDWYRTISGRTNDQHLDEYYRPDIQKIIDYHQGLSNRRIVSGMENWYRNEHTSKYLSGVAYHPKDGMYVGTYGHESILCEIPSVWKELF